MLDVIRVSGISDLRAACLASSIHAVQAGDEWTYDLGGFGILSPERLKVARQRLYGVTDRDHTRLGEI